MLTLETSARTDRSRRPGRFTFDASALVDWPMDLRDEARRIAEASLRRTPSMAEVRVQLAPTASGGFAVWVYERLGARWMIAPDRILDLVLAYDRELGLNPIDPPAWVGDLAD